MMCVKEEQDKYESIKLDGEELRKVDAYQCLKSTKSADIIEDREKHWKNLSEIEKLERIILDIIRQKMPVKLKGNDPRQDGEVT